MKRAAALLLSILCLSCCLYGCTFAAAVAPTQVPTVPPTQPATEPPETVPPVTEPPIKYGWITDDNGQRRFRTILNTYYTGWMADTEKRYYFNEEGIMQTGWLELDGNTYYFHSNGIAATGRTEIDGQIHYFSPSGIHTYLVNPWNPVPDGYTPDLVRLSTDISDEDSFVDRSCYDALVTMIADCNRYSGAKVYVLSAYRSNTDQYYNYQRKISYFRSLGYSLANAKVEAAYYVAVPGTSEHELGLAVDIIDTRLWSLSQKQENYKGQKWLMEHCWEYGFILRYPKDKIDITGIIYEPWHYRYVGKALAKEYYESGLTLEELLGNPR